MVSLAWTPAGTVTEGAATFPDAVALPTNEIALVTGTVTGVVAGMLLAPLLSVTTRLAV